MLRKLISYILPVVLIFSFGATTTVLAEPFMPNEYAEVLNLPECNLSILYITDVWLMSPVTIRGEINYLISSRKDPNVFLRTGCAPAITNKDSTSDVVPYWIGAKPDPTKTKVVKYEVKRSGNQDGLGALYYVIENKANPSKSISLMYNYNTNDFGSWDDVYNKGLLGIQGGFPNWALQLKYITDPVYAADPAPTTTNTQTSPSNNANTSPATVTSASQSPTVIPKATEIKLDDKAFTFDANKYTSCKGKTGKYLNDQGEVIKASKIPKRSNIIKADENGLVLKSANDYIHCVKNAKPFGVVNCQNNLDKALNSKGKKLDQYIRGTIHYASPEFGNIYISPKAGVMCTDNQFFLSNGVFQN